MTLPFIIAFEFDNTYREQPGIERPPRLELADIDIICPSKRLESDSLLVGRAVGAERLVEIDDDEPVVVVPVRTVLRRNVRREVVPSEEGLASDCSAGLGFRDGVGSVVSVTVRHRFDPDLVCIRIEVQDSTVIISKIFGKSCLINPDRPRFSKRNFWFRVCRTSTAGLIELFKSDMTPLVTRNKYFVVMV